MVLVLERERRETGGEWGVERFTVEEPCLINFLTNFYRETR